ncbi:MarR family transcriptional regulator [Paenibacillus andongensis]|uniref:MarR family transcriptional regulator n=1 Tax=Paenibacillus andongensis TaxID=2975482 RepID=UPI0021BB6281|nr:MarR family transcriptional regulator [Paenibacillus andongensis]
MAQPHDEQLLREVFEAFTQFAMKIQQEDDEERAWLLGQCTDLQVQSVLRQMTPMMFHVLDAIGKLGRANGITLSSRFGIPKGTVSKLTKRLAAHGLIVTETIPGNKKELHFAITPQGETIYKLHERLDEQIQAGATRFMADYTQEQLTFLRDFMQKLTSTSFL